MASYEVEAIILGTRPFGESDKMLSVLSLEEGKFDAIVKGARKPKSKNAAFSRAFFHVKMSIYRGRSIDTVNQAEIIDTFPLILSDIYLMANATYISELVKHVMPERDKNEIVFKLLLRTLKEYQENKATEVVTLAMAMKLMAISGFKPELMRCTSCGLDGAMCKKFNVDIGGLLCDSCALRMSGSNNISQELRMTLLKFLGQDYVKLRELELKDINEIENVVNAYVDSKIDKQLRSRDFIYQVRELENNERNVNLNDS